MRVRPHGAGRIRHLDREALGMQEIHEPAAHLAGAADHERALAAALAPGCDLRLFLGREGTADQQSQQVIGERWRQAELRRLGAGVHQHFAFALEVAGGKAGRALDSGDLGGEPLALGDQGEQFAIQSGQPIAQFLEIHSGGRLCCVHPVYRPACQDASGPVGLGQPLRLKLKNQLPDGSRDQWRGR